MTVASPDGAEAPARDVRDDSLVSALRTATRDAHIHLEAALPLTDPDLTRGAYRGIVEAFYGFYVPLEARLAMAPVTGAERIPTNGPQRLARLRADLKALDTSDARTQTLPFCTSLPDLATPGSVLGCLYVVEGSTLGRRVIVRALQDNLELGPLTGAAFFDGYGAETGPMWAAFRTRLDASPWPRRETLAAAVATFVGLEHWLRGQGVLR